MVILESHWFFIILFSRCTTNDHLSNMFKKNYHHHRRHRLHRHFRRHRHHSNHHKENDLHLFLVLGDKQNLFD